MIIWPSVMLNGWARSMSFWDLGVGCITAGLDDDARRAAYGRDVTYGTNNEFGFDYLRDNLKFRLEDMVQRDFHFAIVDEVDSILIDEARTPLIILAQQKATRTVSGGRCRYSPINYR